MNHPGGLKRGMRQPRGLRTGVEGSQRTHRRDIGLGSRLQRARDGVERGAGPHGQRLVKTNQVPELLCREHRAADGIGSANHCAKLRFVDIEQHIFTTVRHREFAGCTQNGLEPNVVECGFVVEPNTHRPRHVGVGEQSARRDPR